MTKYSVTNGLTTIGFSTRGEAEDYILQNAIISSIVEFEEEVVINDNEIRIEQFHKDLEFGKLLVETFLTDNRLLPTSFSDTQNLALLKNFAPIQTLCNSGVIKTAKLMLSKVTPDDIFTKDRKDKYLQMITDYLPKI